MSRRCIIRCITFAAVALATSAVGAQDRYLAEIYGEGVHQIYRGNTSGAEASLSKAINYGFEDSRAYYFRAINKMVSGDSYGGQHDIQMGAQLEVNGRGTYDIGRALERVQGPHRIRFEKMRREALLAAARAKANRSKNAPSRPYDREYLRDARPDKLDLLPNNDVPSAPSGSDPFLVDEDDMTESEDETPEPADDAPEEDSMDEDDPFGDEPEPEDDPFDDAPADDMGDEALDGGDDDMGGDDFGDDMGDDVFDDAGMDDAGAAGDDVPPPAEIEGDMGDDLGDEDMGDPFEDDALESPSDETGDDDLDSLFE